MESKRTATTYFIPPGKFLLMENALGNPDLIQSSVSSDCRVTIVDSANFPLDELEQWPTFRLTSADIKLKLGDGAYYIYIVVPTPDNTESTSAFISYNTALVDRDGYEVLKVTGADGKETTTKGELLGKVGFKYYQCGTITERGGNPSVMTTPSGQGRLIEMDLGVTPSPSTLPGGLNDFVEIFQIDKVDPNNINSWLLTILATIKSMVVRILRITGSIIFGEGENERAITGVAIASDKSDESKISDTILASTAWVDVQFDALDDKYLRKDRDDTAHGNVTFDKAIRSFDFVPGMLMGAGWSVYRDSNGNAVVETDKLIVRQSLKASELIINQETFERGSNIYVKAGCTITKVEENDGFYRCYYDNEEGSRYSGFKYGDQARCQRYDKSFDEIIKYYWRLVINVGDDYVDLSMTDCDGDGVPAEGDDIAQLGHRTDVSRQSAIVISPDNGGSVVIWAEINSFNLSEKNMVGMGVNPITGRSFLYGYGDMFFGDRNLESNFITYQTRQGDTEPKLLINADVELGKNSTGLSNLSEFKDVQTNVDNLLGQAEHDFTIWCFDPIPTLENEPAVNWTTDEIKALHDQDIYYSDALTKAWRFVNGQWVETTDSNTLEILHTAKENNDYIANVLPDKIDELQKQIDGAIESFFYEYNPTLENEPASLWDTNEKKKLHLADTFTNIKTGYSWRWALINEEYKWIEISDTATVEALVAAGRAQDTADQKRRTFIDTPYTPYDEGDLWVQGERGDIMRCVFSREKGEFVETDWEKAGKYTDDSALNHFIEGDYKNQLNEIKKQIDTRSETWYQSTDPSLQWNTTEEKELHVGDLWYDTTKNQSFMWNGTQWITQGVPDEVFDKIDGKASVFVSKPNSYNKNDLWILEADTTLDDFYKAGTIVIAKQSSNEYKSSHWTKRDRYTDDTKAEEALRKAMSYAEALDGIQVDMEIVKSQVDREFTIWYYDPIPTLDNEPAVAWVTDELKKRHDQDIYFSDSLARAWRFQNGEWIEITDERTIAALNKAQDAMEESEEAKKVAEEAAKAAREANSYIENVLPKELDGIKNQIDGAMESFFEEYDPTNSNYPASEWNTNDKKDAHLEDTFTNIISGYSWRWSYSNGAYKWVKITNTATIQALELAGLAKDTADGKRRVFTGYPYTPYDVGDLWVQGEYGDIMRCIHARDEEENYYYFDWEKASKYTDDTKAEEVEDKLSDLDYLKEAFGDDNRVLDGGILMGKIVCVRDANDEVTSFINGSEFAEDEEHGKLVFASGIPSGTSSLESRAKEATTRIYEDGTIISKNAIISGEINATSGIFEDVQIKGSIRSPWNQLLYQVLYWDSESIEQWGYNGSAIYDDKIRLTGGIETPELIMAWGDDADGREIVISNENIKTVMGTVFGMNVKVKVPDGYYIVDEDGTVTSGENDFIIEGKKIYYMTGFKTGWYVNKKISIP